ncbi:anthranilate phosphoribosyltransferase [Alkalihalobacillus alcalophilus ATCC 27647 = CGMCC 1.3604]|uniref:Anthranilate phosphoribosyltransferase n=1 Tax=Alkalihalobacillus alcalophilus ATCC 27647 = CGMCC 1.3604 TaxID=1218173 RepID=A0A094WN03_ALKAL|nr:anthranilate phosphoribosyltransferase [Alkalihalobacillus alcalophilus]KGA99139.1 anthranilate phosphoribosyltransferase [Alkalihalobacillus alcalophilus ATCC 27647 = CGMCC 1.3604]MED1560486.1 anthranilate phosphoribosyltransferase [Alkalihalobacillus alcalophilus]THG92025.1 anthranilate phosphoribosyltransferase [Alkalihalobacillus alcalophilus ATCC 27647 = CGMCC 1.3604]
MLKRHLNACLNGETLSETSAEEVMNEIMNGLATPAQIASFITVMRFRGETVDEITGFARAMRSHSLMIPYNSEHLIDTCGTGGDSLRTFNISTTVALVLSSFGIKVAKHGNRAVSSKSGSADVLEHLGIDIQRTPDEAAKSLENHHLCFLFAPLYHQSMKHAVTPRKELGFRTIFNILGPLTNPAQAKHQLLGVYDVKMLDKMAEALQRLGTKHSLVVSGGEGLDECSITTFTDVVEIKGNERIRYQITPEQFGLTRGKLEEIQVHTPEESAKLILEVLQGKANVSSQNIVYLNAGVALYGADQVASIQEGVELVQKRVETGEVYEHFLQLQGERRESQHA